MAKAKAETVAIHQRLTDAQGRVWCRGNYWISLEFPNRDFAVFRQPPFGYWGGIGVLGGIYTSCTLREQAFDLREAINDPGLFSAHNYDTLETKAAHAVDCALWSGRVARNLALTSRFHFYVDIAGLEATQPTLKIGCRVFRNDLATRFRELWLARYAMEGRVALTELHGYVSPH